MMDSTAIKQILNKSRTAGEAKTPAAGRDPKPGENEISLIQKKILDRNYVDLAIKKIATDLAREFF